MKNAVLLLSFAPSFLVACAGPESAAPVPAYETSAPVPRRKVSIVVDGCSLDTSQLTALESARPLAAELVFLCLVPRATGEVGPTDPSSLRDLARDVSLARAAGASPRLALTFANETGARYDGDQTADALKNADLRARWITVAVERAKLADGLEVDLQNVAARARADVTLFAQELRAALPPQTPLGFLVPPSVVDPSDLPNGEAFDIRALSDATQYLRVMTLDFSDSQKPGAAIDTGWAVDAARLARRKAPQARLDVAYPLYGVDFSRDLRPTRLVTFHEALGLSASTFTTPQRTLSQTLRFFYRDETRVEHEVWFEDAVSTLFSLRMWSYDTLPPDVGVTFYGLGAEDPAVWPALRDKMR